MSAKGCHHLQSFKKNDAHLDALKWIHAVFVVTDTPGSRKVKICNAYCRTCRKRGPFLHACLECVYFGCHKHIRDHMKHQKHIVSMDLSYGQIHCSSCNDYVYDSEVDEITMDNKMQCKTFKKRLFECSSWDATEEEKELLNHRTKKICITPESTIGLRGLLNLGKTCFVNCIVQALIHTPLLRDYFLTERHNCNSVAGACLVCEVSKIFQEFYRGARMPLALHELLHLTWIHTAHLAGYKQQDAHEFFLSTLNILHKHCLDTMQRNSEIVQTENERCPCIIDQIFTGGLQSDLVCKKCNGVSTKIDPIWDFSLDLGPVTLGGRQPSSLHECLERFTRAEHLGQREKRFCSNCQSNEESTKQFTMKTLPIVVSFHLKRFQHINEIEKKISTVISFPEMLDMTPFMSRNKDQSPFPIDNRYSLFAVIIHLGTSINVGHYIAYVRQQHDYWYKCDDDIITRASLKEVLGSEGLVHLDLKGAPPKPAFVAQFFPFLKSLGVTGILLEWEDTFPFTDELIEIGSLGASSASEGHYTPQEASEILQLAKQSSLSVIPLIQTFGHLEFVLKHSKFKHLRELAESPGCLCPSKEDSLGLVRILVTQIMSFHGDIEYIHIGADEVWHLGQCEACVTKAGTLQYGLHSLWLNHVVAVAQYIKNVRPNIKIIIWDDMLRNMDENILRAYDIGNLVEPMVWYYHTSNEFFSPDLWNKYCNVFPNLWAASAFKGATGSRQIMPIVAHHVGNQECWIRGWSRYDHYATLCELLPCGIPSLFLSLITLRYGKLSPGMNESEANTLGYKFPNVNSETSATPPDFPGCQLYISMEWLNHFIKKYKTEIDGDSFNTWLNAWQVNRKYSNPAQLISINATLNTLNWEITLLESHLNESMMDIFYEHTLEEIKGTLLNPIKQNLLKLQKDCKSLLSIGCTTKPQRTSTS